jgi:hypothetical protein
MDPTLYHSLSLVELKQIAKTRRIKMYYIKKRAELIQLLGMTELPVHMKIEKMTIHDLRAEAKKRDIRGYWTLRREKLVELLFPENDGQRNSNETPAHQNEKNHGDAYEHDSPQEHESEDVRV